MESFLSLFLIVIIFERQKIRNSLCVLQRIQLHTINIICFSWKMAVCREKVFFYNQNQRIILDFFVLFC